MYYPEHSVSHSTYGGGSMRTLSGISFNSGQYLRTKTPFLSVLAGQLARP